jgi:eukaryotic-like serine/threonine-protein kinase
MPDILDRLKAALSDRYAIERKLGDGGMAEVFLALDLKHQRRVAVKVLRPELAAVLGADRFLAEIRTTAALQHPHILTLFDSGEADNLLYYVMPFVAGESLRGKLDREKQLGVEEAVQIARDVADALEYAHRAGVVHRDIKPENILLHGGRPVVADFGIALAVSAAGAGRMTETGLSLGTPHYMSPEQASADRDVTPRSDQYSLACVLYEMLAGAPPHTGPTSQAVLMRILTEEPRPVEEVRRSVPANVGAAIAKALEKLPADRFESSAQFRAALADPSFEYQPTSTRAYGAAPANSNRHGSAGSARSWIFDPRSWALAAALIAALVWAGLARANEAARYATRLSLDLGGLRHHLTSDLQVSPDGSLFVVAATNASGERGLFLRRADELDFEFVPGTEDGFNPYFSPDGAWILFVAPGWSLLKVPVSGGAPTTVIAPNTLSTPISNPSWSDEGLIYFTSGVDLLRIPAAGGTADTVHTSPGWISRAHALPGGKGLLVGRPALGGVGVIAPGEDSVRILVEDGRDATYLATGYLLYGHATEGLLAAPFDLGKLELTGPPVTVQRNVHVFLEAHYSISHDGTLVYGQGGYRGLLEVTQLLLIDFAGRVDTIPLDPRIFHTPRWSPDGRSIAYSSGDPNSLQIFTYDVEVGSSPKQLTTEGHNLYVAWSPDGGRIGFSSLRTGTRIFDLFAVSASGDSPETPLIGLPGIEDLRGWPSDDLIVFETAAPGSTSDLWSASVSAGKATAYLESEADNDDITVSRDGAWAAYQSDESGDEALFVRSFPTPGRPVRISEGEGQFPRWSPDGETLYYWALSEAGADTLFAATLSGGPARSVLSRKPVLWGSFTPENWDLHPSGRQILVAARQRETEGERFTVVLNWFEELKAKLGTPP